MKNNLFSTLAAVLLMAFALTSCSSNTPSGVVKSFYSNMKSGNVEKAVRYLDVDEAHFDRTVDKYTKMLNSKTGTAEMYKEGKVKIVSEHVNGDEAEVEVSIMVSGYGMSTPVFLKKIDGDWKITSN